MRRIPHFRSTCGGSLRRWIDTAQIHGATRPTLDFDAVVSFEAPNLNRLCTALRELGARIRAEGFSDDEAQSGPPAMLHPQTFRSAELTTWMTDAGPLDSLDEIPARNGVRQCFHELAERATTADFAGIRVRVATIEDIPLALGSGRAAKPFRSPRRNRLPPTACCRGDKAEGRAPHCLSSSVGWLSCGGDHAV